MAFESLLFSQMSADPRVSAIVDQRIRPHMAQQDDPYPFVIYTVSKQPLQCAAGPVSNALTQGTLSLSLYSTTYDEDKSLAAAARACLGNWSTTNEGAGVYSCRLINETEDSGVESEGSEVIVFRVSQEYSIWIVEE